MRSKYLRACALVLLLCASAADAKVYKWVDANGMTQYSESPPKGQAVSEVQAPAAPQNAPHPATLLEQMQQADNLLAEKKHKDAAEDHARAEAARAAAIKKAKCLEARNAQAQLQSQRRLYTIGADGQKVYMGDEARASEAERVSKEISENCE